MKARMMTILAAAAFAVVACKQEAPPPPPAQIPAPIPAPQALQPQAAVPGAQGAPTVVFASADPQHGGVTQKVGDYMVELATGGEGEVDFYVQKYEGALQSFETVQLAVTAESKTATDEDGAPQTQHVVFFPEDGKLQGTVAGMEKGAYDFHVRVFDITTSDVAIGEFENVEIDPLKTELEPKHEGTVTIIEKTKMELVADDNKLKVYLRDLDDNPLPTAINRVEDVTIGVGEEGPWKVILEPIGDHYEGDIEGEIVEGREPRLIFAKLVVGDKKYRALRINRFPWKVRPPHPKKQPELTRTDAKKLDKPKAMKGTIGSMKVGAPPPKLKGKPTKTSKGPVTMGKKAKGSSPPGKKTKTSKGPVTKGKKAK